jgi:hypothetical protein
MYYYVQHIDIRDKLDQTHEYEQLEYHPELWKFDLAHDQNDLDLRNFCSARGMNNSEMWFRFSDSERQLGFFDNC